MSFDDGRIMLEPDAEGPGARRWWLFHGTGEPPDADLQWPPAPPWRRFAGPVVDGPPPPEDDEEISRLRGEVSAMLLTPAQVSAVNVALLLRRPILVTAAPGSGQAGLAHLIARELRLGRVLRWSVNRHTTLRDGVHDFDALGLASAAIQLRADQPVVEPGAPPGTRRSVKGHLADLLGHDAERRPPDSLPVHRYVRLGPLGTALLGRTRPRVLLIDRLDRSGYDLPDDVLDVLDEGRAVVPELARLPPTTGPLPVAVDDPGAHALLDAGIIQCAEPPVVVITSSGERDFSPTFHGRCVHLRMPAPSRTRLQTVAESRYGAVPGVAALIARFDKRRSAGAELTIDQLLDALHLAAAGVLDDDSTGLALDAVWGGAADDPSAGLP
ncbi:hypothetical protein FF36_04882 [Frankia torreyi]|uniref:AAA domain n=1 Tax=Frankia torreyi TaxID=1856 RepID=A0A0D8BA74_9ACTN|nr:MULTISPECIES: hypothetical protein [Frankia]KJE20834.1 hypothetical protein FF36_04882 [Frankia torreyi]